MSSRIVIYGDPVLREKAEPVEKITKEIKALVADMVKIMRVGNGVGLAAEQIGRTERICVIDIPKDLQEKSMQGKAYEQWHAMPLVLINPEILESSGSCTAQEGCLSFPEIFVKIKRASDVKVSFMDIDGKTCSIEADGLLARAIQHEIDHLNGVLLVDRMSAVQKVANAGRLKRLKKEASENIK